MGEATAAAVPTGARPRVRPALLVPRVAGAGPTVLHVGHALGQAASVLAGRPDATPCAPVGASTGRVGRPMTEGHVAEGRPTVAPRPPVVTEGVAGGVVLKDGPVATASAVVALVERRAPTLLPSEEGPVLRVLRDAVRPRAATPNMEVAPVRVGLGGPHATTGVTVLAATSTVEVAAMAVHVAHPASDVVAVAIRARLAKEGSAVVPVAGRCP